MKTRKKHNPSIEMSIMIKIRAMTTEDIPEVFEVERKSFPYPFGEVLIGNIYFGAPELCYVMKDEDKVIGFLLGGYTHGSNND